MIKALHSHDNMICWIDSISLGHTAYLFFLDGKSKRNTDDFTAIHPPVIPRQTYDRRRGESLSRSQFVRMSTSAEFCFELLVNRSGDIESSFSENEKIELGKAGPVRCVDVDLDGRYVVTTAEDKMLKVWIIEDGEGGLRLMNQR